MPSQKFQEYQCSDGSTFSGRLLPSIFPNHQSGELLNVHRVFSSRILRLACSEYLFSDGRTFSRRLSPACPQAASLAQSSTSRTWTVVATLRCQSASSPVKQPSASKHPQAPSQATRREMPKPGFPPRPCACGGPLTSPRGPSGISLLDGSTFSGRLPPSLFPNLQPGEVVDIQNMLRRESSSLSSREVPEHSDGRVFSGHPSAL